MADISINTQFSKPIITDMAVKADMKEEAAKEVKDEALVTSEAIKNSKVEADTLTTKSKDVKQEEPVITEEMINNLSNQVENITAGKPNEQDSSKHIQEDVIKSAAEKAKEKIGAKTKDEPKTAAEYAQQKQEERKLKKAEKQAKAEQKAQAENSKMATGKKVVNSKTGKVTNLTVRIVKDENGKWKAERPKTPEYSAFDQYMQKSRTEYIKEHPEPAFSNDNSDSESAEHAKWVTDKKKNEKSVKKDYIQQNKAFAEQNAAYVKAQAKARELNK